jgi:hypothetical protein
MKRTLWVGLVVVGLAAVLGWAWYLAGRDVGTSSPFGLGSPSGSEGAESETAASGGTPEPRVIERVAASGVRVRIERRPRIDLPAPPYADRVRELQPAADRGDAVARYQLGMTLYQCRDAPVDEPGLARAIEEIHQTRTRQGWEVTDPEQEEQAVRTIYGQCAGVPSEARTRYRDLLRAAAEQGLMEAQLNLMFFLPQAQYCQYIEDCTPQQAKFMAGLREESRSNVLKALEAGSVEALRTVGGWALNEEMGTPDEVEAYAYFSAYDQIQQATGREREMGMMLAGLTKRLRPVDLERGQARAKELLSNPRCCVLTRLTVRHVSRNGPARVASTGPLP